MAALIREIPNSRQWTEEPVGLTTHWLSIGEFDDSAVRIAARSTIPGSYLSERGTLYRGNMQVIETGFKQYNITAPYGIVKRETGTWTFDYDLTGATVHITAGKEHIRTYPDDGNIHKGSIGVKTNGDIDGADIIIPALKFNIRYRHPHGVVTMPFVRNQMRAVGCTNALPYLDHAAGELLFLGGTGSDGTESDAEASYQFASSENVTDLSFGDITGIVKQGHHIAWVEHGKKTEDGKPSTQPIRVHIERVYNSVDMATILGFQ